MRVLKVFFIPLIIAIFHVSSFSGAALSYSSADIPVHNWSYEALEKLAIGGIVGLSGIDTRPMTRVQMAYKIKEAMDNIESENIPSHLALDREQVEYLQAILYKLINEFRQELILIGAKTAQVESDEDRPAWNKFFSVNLASPIAAEHRFASVKSQKDTLLENENGLRLSDGYNLRTRVNPWVNAFNLFTFSARPEFLYNEKKTNVFFDEAAAKFSLFNIELSLAKSAMWWGPGYHGAMLISNNAEPLTLARARTINNFRFPWIFAKLGTFGVNFFVSKLEKERVFPEPTFAGLRLEYSPFPRLSLAASRTAIMGGKGRSKLRLSDYWRIFTANSELSHDPAALSRADTDQLAAFDAKFAMPLKPEARIASGFELYGEWAGEDKFAFWENESPGFLAGLFLVDVLRNKGTDLRVEYAKTKPNWYQHGIYNVLTSTQAYSYKGNIMGHNMGGDAEDLFFRISKDLPFLTTPFFNSVKAGLEFDTQRSPLTETSGVSKQQLMEVALDVTWFHSDLISFLMKYEFENYRNFNNVAGERARNHIFSLETDIKF